MKRAAGVLSFFLALQAFAATQVYNFGWNASTSPSVFDYRIYWGFFQSQDIWLYQGGGYGWGPCTPGTPGCVHIGTGSAAKLSNQVDVGSLLTGSIAIDWSQDTDTFLIGAAVTVVGWDGAKETGPSNVLTLVPTVSPTPSPTPSQTPTPTSTPTPTPTPT